MKLQILVLAVAMAVSTALPAPELDQQWSSFKQQYNKKYASAHEELFRKTIFADNVKLIQQHNSEFSQGLHSYDLAVNEFADMTLPEFRRQRNGVIVSKSTQMASEVFEGSNRQDLPAEVDWTKKGVVVPVKNQGNCGSCWAFAAVSAMESAHALKTGKLVSLSEQELVDCSGNEGDMGCSGGWMDNGYRFVMDKHGIDTEASYPYVAQDETCKDKPNNRTIGATISKYVDVKSRDESALQEACATVGPISVGIDASSNNFMFYKSGVYDHNDCSQDMLDHGVTVVGYGTLNGKQYWKVRNSWGTDWGMDGYILMSRNRDNQCGIATKASYPVV